MPRQPTDTSKYDFRYELHQILLSILWVLKAGLVPEVVVVMVVVVVVVWWCVAVVVVVMVVVVMATVGWWLT